MNGNLVKLPAGFEGTISNKGNIFHAIVIKGQPKYQSEDSLLSLETGNYFGADKESSHQISTVDETIIYVRTNNKFKIIHKN